MKYIENSENYHLRNDGNSVSQIKRKKKKERRREEREGVMTGRETEREKVFLGNLSFQPYFPQFLGYFPDINNEEVSLHINSI